VDIIFLVASQTTKAWTTKSWQSSPTKCGQTPPTFPSTHTTYNLKQIHHRESYADTSSGSLPTPFSLRASVATATLELHVCVHECCVCGLYKCICFTGLLYYEKAHSICSLGRTVKRVYVMWTCRPVLGSKDEKRTNDDATWPCSNHGLLSQHHHCPHDQNIHFCILVQACRVPVFHHTALCIVLAAES
jgi:hypothetical protein